MCFLNGEVKLLCTFHFARNGELLSVLSMMLGNVSCSERVVFFHFRHAGWLLELVLRLFCVKLTCLSRVVGNVHTFAQNAPPASWTVSLTSVMTARSFPLTVQAPLVCDLHVCNQLGVHCINTVSPVRFARFPLLQGKTPPGWVYPRKSTAWSHSDSGFILAPQTAMPPADARPALVPSNRCALHDFHQSGEICTFFVSLTCPSLVCNLCAWFVCSTWMVRKWTWTLFLITGCRHMERSR